MIAPLTEACADRIVVGDRTFFLRAGTMCNYPPGTRLEVVYTEQDGRREAESIKPTTQER